MKKRAIVFIACVLLLSFLFVLPSEAVSGALVRTYLLKNATRGYNSETDSLGSRKYWERQIKEKKWKGETRPEPLMGDANIDGKVNAVDALFALHFSVYGNVQTAIGMSGLAQAHRWEWQRQLEWAYKNGTVQKLADSTDTWLRYCQMNSPFFADVTKDCNVNAKDALEILKYSVGKAKDFPEGDFTSVFGGRFGYYPWPTEYYPDIWRELDSDMTDAEFCEKYNFYPDVSPTDQ